LLSRVFERKPGDFFNSMGAIVAGTAPGETRYGAVIAGEENRWVVTLVGSIGDHPPTNQRRLYEGMKRFRAAIS
jgi:hypothetical protein